MDDESNYKSGDAAPSHHSSTHSPDCIRGVAQDEGRGFCTVGDRAANAVSTTHITPQKIPMPPSEPHPEPTRSVVSKDTEEKVCNESTETKKQKNEIEQTAQTPQTRKTKANRNIIQPAGEMCALSITQTRECIPSTTTHTDKRDVPFRDAVAQPYKAPADADPAQSPP